MTFEIENLSNAENELVKKAREDYRICFDNPNKLLSLMGDFILEEKPKDSPFILFLSLVQKYLYLAFLSTIRRHDIQALMMLRQVLESAVLACYGLYETNFDKFGTIDSNGLLQINENVKDKAYKWIEKKYSTYSNKIKAMKATINSYASHPSIVAASVDIDCDELEGELPFFDQPHMLITKQRLWWIANVAFGLITLFVKIIHDFPLVKLDKNIDDRLKVLGTENDRIKNDLQKDPRFSKWL